MKKHRPITKAQAIALFGKGRGAQQRLAEALGLTRQAVSYWREGPIPDRHDLRLRYEIKPEVFQGTAVIQTNKT